MQRSPTPLRRPRAPGARTGPAARARARRWPPPCSSPPRRRSSPPPPPAPWRPSRRPHRGATTAEPAAYATIPLYLEGLTTLPGGLRAPLAVGTDVDVPGRHPRGRSRGDDAGTPAGRARGHRARRDGSRRGHRGRAAARVAGVGTRPGIGRPLRGHGPRCAARPARPDRSPTARRSPAGRTSGGTCGRATRRSSPSPWRAPGTSTTPWRSSASSTACSRRTARSRRATCPTAPGRPTTAACRRTARAGRCGPRGWCVDEITDPAERAAAVDAAPPAGHALHPARARPRRPRGAAARVARLLGGARGRADAGHGRAAGRRSAAGVRASSSSPTTTRSPRPRSTPRSAPRSP